MATFSNNIDYSKQLKKLIAQKASSDEILHVIGQREAKIASNPNLSKYDDDAIENEARNYVRGLRVQPEPFNPTTSSNQSYISKQARLQQQATIAGLNKARNQSLSNLADRKATIKPKYYNARNDASTQSKMNAKSFAEYYAQNGLNKSGDNTQARIANNVALQRNIGNLKQSEAEEFAGIERDRMNINNAYASDVASAKANIEAQRLQALINQQNADRNYNLQERQVNSQLKAQDITNQINQLKLKNLPAELKANLEMINQQVQKGQIDIDTANYQLEQMLDPNSQYNRMQDAEYQAKLANINYTNALTGNVGVDNRTEEEIIRDQLENDILRAELDGIQNPSAEDVDEDTLGAAYTSMMNSDNPEQWLLENAPYMTTSELKYLQGLLK